jgi:hypothetical protein
MFKETDEDKYGPKCVCGHFRINHHDGPIKEEKDKFFLVPDFGDDEEGLGLIPLWKKGGQLEDNKVNCRNGHCPQYRRKRFWSKQEHYALKERK